MRLGGNLWAWRLLLGVPGSGVVALGFSDVILSPRPAGAMGAVVIGAMALALGWGWRKTGHPAVAVAQVGALGVPLLFKPWLWPIETTWDGETSPLGPFAELHLYALAAGLGLCVAAGVLVATAPPDRP